MLITLTEKQDLINKAEEFRDIVDNLDEKLFFDPIEFAQRLLWLRTKAGKVIPFFLNKFQIYLETQKLKAIRSGKKPSFLVLKSRKGGITTWEQAKSFWLASMHHGQYCLTLAHDHETTQKIFDISQLFYDRIDPFWRAKRKTQNKREFDFCDLGSKFYIGTAGSPDFGRGQTLQRVHGSECAFWPEQPSDNPKESVTNLVAGLMEACSSGEIVFESTPNGRQGFFYHEWQRAKNCDSDFTPIFLPWWLDELNIISLLPGEKLELDSEESGLFLKHGLTFEQIKFRRAKKKSLKALFAQEYPEDDITCFLFSGGCFFEIQNLTESIQKCKEPIELRHNGLLKIWKYPEANKVYVAGADVGEGLKTGDYSSLMILDKAAGEQVAALHGHWRPDIFANKIAEICKEYNTALLAVEANNHGHSVLNTLINVLCYPNVYKHENYDGTGAQKLGWQTNGKTRSIMLDDLEAAISGNWIIINDTSFIEECLTFCDNGKGHYEAMPGCHDDKVMACAIAWQARKVKARIIEYCQVSQRRVLSAY